MIPIIAVCFALVSGCVAAQKQTDSLPIAPFLEHFKQEGFDVAFIRLSTGTPKPAASVFRTTLASPLDPHSIDYTDALRGLFLADLYAGSDKATAADLSSSIEQAGSAPAGGSAVARGDWTGAWNDFLHDYDEAHGRCTDSTVESGLHSAINGDLTRARSAWRRFSSLVGDCDIPFDPFMFANGADTKSALIGVSFVQQRRWRQAEAALLVAVLYYRGTSGRTTLFPGNIIAMQTLFAYRMHFKRGQGRYRWPALHVPDNYAPSRSQASPSAR